MRPGSLTREIKKATGLIFNGPVVLAYKGITVLILLPVQRLPVFTGSHPGKLLKYLAEIIGVVEPQHI